MNSDKGVPRVSVVVPAYNNVDFIAQTIESILEQDYSDFEVVIADHSSSDETEDVVRRYAAHPAVRILPQTPPGGGALVNWNRVSSYARGELLKLVCGDDLLMQGALKEQVSALDAYPSAVLVASPRALINAHGQVMLRRRGLGGLRGLVPGCAAVRATVRAGTNIFGEPACVMFKREILQRIGGWDGRFPYLIDEATYVRIARYGDVVALPKVLAAFRISAGQWSVRLARDQARQTRAFHAALEAECNSVLRRDVALGNARAVASAFARRSIYGWLRLRASTHLEQSRGTGGRS